MTDSDSKTLTRNVKGMTCGNCALTISRALEKNGATHVSANAASGEVNYTTVTAPQKMDAIIESLGYEVVLPDVHGDNADHSGHNHGNQASWMLGICILLTLPLLAHMFTNWAPLHNAYVQLALATPVFFIGWWTFGKNALMSLKHLLPNMNVLILMGASAAYAYSIIGLVGSADEMHKYIFFETAASIITLVMVGNWLEHRTVKSTTAAIDDLIRLQPQKARILQTDSIGKEHIMEVDQKHVRSGDVVIVTEGEAIPVDGKIIKGTATVDEKMITGESAASEKTIDDAVVGGTILAAGNIRITATTVGKASVLESIVRMVREAQSAKPPLQKLADRISVIFVPLVFGIAIITFLVNYFLVAVPVSDSLMRAIAVLVVSCPCAMGLATPAALAVGLGRAARMGILVKGSSTLEQLKTIRQVVFDKTGTLTTGDLKIASFEAVSISPADFKNIVASLEQHSSHPIAKSISQQWKQEETIRWENVEEVKGKGMQGTDNKGDVWKLGSARWNASTEALLGGDLYLTKNGDYAGCIILEDDLRHDAAAAVKSLHDRGIVTVLLSGDRQEKTSAIAKKLGIDTVYAEKSPEQKHDILQELMKNAPTAMVGDGINDAPALALATVGISLSTASQIAMQSASVVLTGGKLSTLPQALRLGKLTDSTIKQNLFWAFIYNIIAIPFAAMGYLSPIWGAGLMALSDVVLILNSLRLRYRNLG